VKKLDAIEALANLQLTLSTAPKREMNSVFATREQKEAYARAYIKSAEKKAEKVKDAIDDVHKAMEKRVLDSDLTVNNFMDVQREKKLAKDALTPIMVKLYTEGGQEALNALAQKSAEHFFADAVLLSAIEGRVEFFTDSIMDTTFEILKSKIVDGVKNGDGVDVIAKTIRDYFDDMSKGRAKTIAQTETNFVLSKSTNDAYAQSSIVTGKEWLTVGDDKVREEHVENDGVIVGKGEAFPSGEMYPAEHSVNCRCALLPTV
jgi:SPP1 gp7 family putative phage head morphogenesis protein